MTNPEPVSTVNLDQYGNEALPWSAVVERLEAEIPAGKDLFTVLGTVLPDGRPHAAPVGAVWIDGAWYVVLGPASRKARNLADNPACTLTARLEGIDVVFTGRVERVTGADDARTHSRGLPAIRLACGGGRRRVHGAVLRAEWRAAALVRPPDCLRAGRRGWNHPVVERRSEMDVCLKARGRRV